ncbi:reprolysin-like metallopeptidase [Flavobacterium antarcticum]|uniref:reprolysin-like metallopeptidase n=1 Tax=Flavobacterium antarcticum TaxID=271155 RepID=UPI0003B451D4|nr:zinc-dependent metalloprotease family protein [Flavobacterium antarcticum]
MKKITLLLIAIFTFSLSFGQNAWTKSDESRVGMLEKVNRSSFPTTYKLFQLDLVKFKQQLEGAPVRGAFSGRSTQLIYLPNAEGYLERFYVMETPIMEAELARKFPMIKSYAAQGVDNPGSVARFSVTQFGLHNITFTPGKSTIYIDPYTSDLATYIVYERSALSETAQDFECLTAEDVALPSLERNILEESRANATDDSKLRTYRLALSCTGEYGALFAGAGTVQQKKANIQARMAITMTRVNGVYERDLAITMIFVANNDLIIYFNASNDPWTGEYNTKTAQTIDAAIGLANYDIGHNFNTSGGGNAGCIGCVCSTTSSPSSSSHKGRGYTGRSNPTGDAFDIDYVAHEMGHQFGGYHTQSNSSCFSGSGLTEVEPGSASTIMGYAGICAPNVQNKSDDYFHYVNIRDITNNIKSGVSSSCAQITVFTNTAPVVSPLQNYVIPKSTPFVLTGNATDADGDALNYTWEQNDPELSNQANSAGPGQFETSGPLFRSERGTVSPSRFFPKKATILAGQLATTWEVLPAVGRVMNFALTVRDNAAGGGQTGTGEMKVTVSDVAGPFSITSQNATISYPGGSNQIITWDVASTDLAPVNTRFVDIYMSTNNGSTFPILLASQVPNDGSEIVTIPNLVGTTNRIMVQGHDNIFFDISNANFTITEAPSTFSVTALRIEGEQNKSVCKGGSLNYTLSYETYGGFSGTTTFTAANLPAGITVSFNPASATSDTDVLMTLNSSTDVIPQLYTINVQAVSGGTTKVLNFYANILDNAFTAVNLTTPTNAAVVTPNEVLFNWTASNGATNYDVQIATDANFDTIVETATVATNSYISTTLESLQSYFWRIQPKNEGCSAAFSNASTFSTTFCGFAESLDVPIGISLQPSTITSTITVDALDSVTINDVKVKLDISHTWISDLTVTLTSPNGTVVQLFSNKCGSRDNIIATFDDAGTTIFCGTNPAISGTIIPAQPLAGFNGQTSQGVWTLTVSDLTNGDGGVLNSWGINFCSPTPPLEVVKNEFSDLMVYPNPNSGNFNVKFNNATTDKVTLKVYDMSGRTIFNKNYNVKGNFNENVQLNTIQSGVYLMAVSDGERTQVERIIIK